MSIPTISILSLVTSSDLTSHESFDPVLHNSSHFNVTIAHTFYNNITILFFVFIPHLNTLHFYCALSYRILISCRFVYYFKHSFLIIFLSLVPSTKYFMCVWECLWLSITSLSILFLPLNPSGYCFNHSFVFFLIWYSSFASLTFEIIRSSAKSFRIFVLISSECFIFIWQVSALVDSLRTSLPTFLHVPGIWLVSHLQTVFYVFGTTPMIWFSTQNTSSCYYLLLQMTFKYVFPVPLRGLFRIRRHAVWLNNIPPKNVCRLKSATILQSSDIYILAWKKKRETLLNRSQVGFERKLLSLWGSVLLARKMQIIGALWGPGLLIREDLILTRRYEEGKCYRALWSGPIISIRKK